MEIDICIWFVVVICIGLVLTVWSCIIVAKASDDIDEELEKKDITNSCVVCGRYIPEGMMVCRHCIEKNKEKEK